MTGWSEWNTIISVIGGGGALSIAVILWMRRRWVHPAKAWVARLNRAVGELSPNGGESINDRIGRMDASIKTMGAVVQESSARVLSILGRDRQPYYECGPDGACTYANASLCALFGLTPEEMLANGWLAAIRPTDRPGVLELWQKCVRNGIPYESTYQIRDGSGGWRPIRTTAAPMFGADGQIIGYAGNIHDVD